MCDFLCSCWYFCLIWLIYYPSRAHYICNNCRKNKFFFGKTYIFSSQFFSRSLVPTNQQKQHFYSLSTVLHGKKSLVSFTLYISMCFYWQKWIMVCRIFVTLNHRHNSPLVYTSIMTLQYFDPYANVPQCNITVQNPKPCCLSMNECISLSFYTTHRYPPQLTPPLLPD